ncbi:MAG: hypothetical protein Q9162_006536 [Coniocarpon cinnabarinum]
MSALDTYQTPLGSRYASRQMLEIFSARRRINTWRQLWIWLAEAEAELGLSITPEAIQQLRQRVSITDDEFNVAREEEKRVRHDVMAHVHTYGTVAPAAAGIIHLGATSCFVTDNADQIFMRDGLQLLLPKLAACIKNLSNFALQYKDLAVLSYTHYQSAMLTTIGKRFSVYTQSLIRDLRNLERTLSDLLDEFRGCKGTTGTQASFLKLFNGDYSKVKQLDKLVTQKAGFRSAAIVTTQTYDRKIDVDILQALGSFGATVQKLGHDIRLLASFKEMDEPFEKDQTGSSAMAFKRNPIRSERLCSLGRVLSNSPANAIDTYASQGMERTLDDSAARRQYIPESFLLADACLILLHNVSSGLVVYPQVIQRRIDAELPFMATENVIAALVAKGESRQKAHEEIKVLSHEASAKVKVEGGDNDLIERIKRNKFFEPILSEMDALLDPKTFIGCAPEQVTEFVEFEAKPAIAKYEEAMAEMGNSVLNI